MSDNVLDDLEQRLQLKGKERRTVVRELRSHLAESQKYLEACGRSPEAARSEAIARFGDPIEVADMLSAVHIHRAPRVRSVAAAAFLVAVTTAGFGAAVTFAAYGMTTPLPAHRTQHHRHRASHGRPVSVKHANLRVHHAPVR